MMYNNASQNSFESAQEAIRAYLEGVQSHALLHPRQKERLQRLMSQPKLDYPSFRETIPILNKNDVFGDPDAVKAILRERRARGVQIVPSAGTQNGDLLAFRLRTPESEVHQFHLLLGRLEKMWGMEREQTFILNAYPSGIHIPEGFHSAECGARPELLALALKLVSSEFRHLVLICQPHFLRACLDDRVLAPEDLGKLKFLLGGAWFPKTMTSYLASWAGIAEREMDGRILSLYGAAEIGLGIGAQTPLLSEVRRSLSRAQIAALNVTPSVAAPMLLQVDPSRYFVESVDGRIVITNLSAELPIPFLRYQVGDLGKVVTGEDLSLSGYILALESRKPGNLQDYSVHSDEVEELLFGEAATYSTLRGDFLIDRDQLTLAAQAGQSGAEASLELIRERLRGRTKVALIHPSSSRIPALTDLLRKPRRYV